MVDSADCADLVDVTREDCLAGKSPEWAADNRNVAIFKPATLSGECPSSGPCSIGDWIDFTFLMLFAVEMVIKMTAMGLMMHPNSYLRNSWNWLDFLVVIIGCMPPRPVAVAHLFPRPAPPRRRLTEPSPLFFPQLRRHVQRGSAGHFDAPSD